VTIDLAALRVAFPELTGLVPLSAQSGQKEVLQARLSGALVVLKLIRTTPQIRERTQREIEAVSKLGCNYVSCVHLWGERVVGGTAQFFLIEDWIDGGTYRERLNKQPRQPLAKVLALGDALLSACVDFAAKSLVHRDLKPENLIVDTSEKLWVIDFGIVRLLEEAALTPTSDRFGRFTPGYGAPEQVRNLQSEIDGRADLFSVGVMLHEALAGGNPYRQGKRDALQIIQHVLNIDLPRLSIPGDIYGELADLIASLSSRYRSRRPPTARDALTWLHAIRTRIAPQV
jgi:eukaryotic-like serine/threonine-protein kinase